MIIDTATWSLFYKNIQGYVESIFTGTLDFLLVQPIDPQFHLSTKYIGFSNIPRFFIGLFLIAKNFPHLSLLQVVLYILLILVASNVIYMLWFFTATFTFWVEKLDNIVEIAPTLRRIWSVPSDVYSGPISTIFTMIIPFALVTTTPARVLFHEYRWDEIVKLCILSIVMFLITRLFFSISIRKYSSIGS